MVNQYYSTQNLITKQVLVILSPVTYAKYLS